MRIIALSTLREFWGKHPDVERPLKAWYAVTSRAQWKNPGDVKQDYPAASILENNRVVFNINAAPAAIRWPTAAQSVVAIARTLLSTSPIRSSGTGSNTPWVTAGSTAICSAAGSG